MNKITTENGSVYTIINSLQEIQYIDSRRLEYRGMCEVDGVYYSHYFDVDNMESYFLT